MIQRSELTIACLRLLRPLARIMLRHGLSTYDFSRIANIAFVRAAGDILREQGKPLSFSRVSAITGLHRHVVSDIVNSPGSGESETRPTKTTAAIAWRASLPAGTRVRFIPMATDGRLVLAPDGPSPSFASLVREFSGDIYPGIILDELREVGAIALQKDGSVRALSRRYSVGGAEAAAIEHLGNVARDRLQHARAQPRQPSRAAPFTTTRSSRLRLDRAALPLFRRLLRSAALRSSRTSRVGLQSTKGRTQRMEFAPA